MQKLYAMFPSGLPGWALLLMRGSVATHAVMCGTLGHGPGVLRVAAGAAAMLLVVGYLTPLAAGLCALLAPWPLLFDGGWNSNLLFALADAIALLFLGPGAFSVDARLFGRRVVVLSSGE